VVMFYPPVSSPLVLNEIFDSPDNFRELRSFKSAVPAKYRRPYFDEATRTYREIGALMGFEKNWLEPFLFRRDEARQWKKMKPSLPKPPKPKPPTEPSAREPKPEPKSGSATPTRTPTTAPTQPQSRVPNTPKPPRRALS